MAITKKQTPYQFLARWGDSGILQGASVAFREAALEDGVEISSKYSDPLPISLAGGAGFPLAEILGALQASALTAGETKDVEIVQLKAQKEIAEKAKADAETAAEALASENATLKAQLAELLKPPEVTTFSRKQLKVAFNEAGWLEEFEAMMASPEVSEDKLSWISWQEDESFTETSPALLLTFARMKKTAEEVAAIFLAASKV